MAADCTFVPLAPAAHDRLCGWVRAYFGEDGLDFTANVASALAELLNHPELGIAWEIMLMREAVGCCVLTYGFDDEAGGRIGMITNLYVAPEHRGRRIGTAALEQCAAHATEKGLRQLELFVLHSNSRARKLYLANGFGPAEDREFLSRRL